MQEKPAQSSQIKIPELLERLTRISDDLIRIPGTNIRIGTDPFIGLIPGVGDLMTTGLSVYIIYAAARIGAPTITLFKMIGNVFVDASLGAFPIVGDIFDFGWKANRKNMTLLKSLAPETLRPRNNIQVIYYLRFAAAALFISFCLLIFFIIWLVVNLVS